MLIGIFHDLLPRELILVYKKIIHRIVDPVIMSLRVRTCFWIAFAFLKRAYFFFGSELYNVFLQIQSKFNGVVLYTHGFGRCSLADRAFSKLLRETLDSIGCPLLALEGDCMDASIDPCSTVTKISSFVEALNLSRYGNIFGKTTS